MKGLIFLLATFAFDISQGQNFADQSYLLTDRLFDECNVESGCDCCASNLIFISDKRFVLVEYCVDHGSYYTGTYEVTNGKMSLEFKQVKVDEEFNYDKKQLIEKRQAYKRLPIEFQISICKDGKLIFGNSKPEYRYGTRQPKEGEVKTVTEIRKSQPYKLLIN